MKFGTIVAVAVGILIVLVIAYLALGIVPQLFNMK